MGLNKLMPVAVLLAIAWHSKSAIQERLSLVPDLQNRLVAEQNMRLILRQARMAAIDSDNFRIENLRDFVRANVERGLDGSDPSIDPWGRPYRFDLRNGRMTLKCAGPDQRWGSADDLERSEMLF